MTTDTTALQERIARALYENAEYYGPAPTQPPWDWRDDEERGEWMEIAAAVLPIIAAEVQAAKAEAWAEGKLWKAEARIRHLEDTAQVLVKEVLDAENARAENRRGKAEAEARIKAVEDVLDRWQVDGYDALLRRIRRALEG